MQRLLKVFYLLFFVVFFISSVQAKAEDLRTNVLEIERASYLIVMRAYDIGAQYKRLDYCRNLHDNGLSRLLSSTHGQAQIAFARVLYSWVETACVGAVRGTFTREQVDREIRQKLRNWGCGYGVCDQNF